MGLGAKSNNDRLGGPLLAPLFFATVAIGRILSRTTFPPFQFQILQLLSTALPPLPVSLREVNSLSLQRARSSPPMLISRHLTGFISHDPAHPGPSCFPSWSVSTTAHNFPRPMPSPAGCVVSGSSFPLGMRRVWVSCCCCSKTACPVSVPRFHPMGPKGGACFATRRLRYTVFWPRQPFDSDEANRESTVGSLESSSSSNWPAPPSLRFWHVLFPTLCPARHPNKKTGQQREVTTQRLEPKHPT